MNIVINGLPLLGLVTGIGRYVRCLYSAMAAHCDVKISYYTGSATGVNAMPSAVPSRIWCKNTARLWRLPDGAITGLNALSRFRFERSLLRFCKESPFHLYHETDFFPAPLKHIPVMYTLHDLSLLQHPEQHPKERVWYFNLFFKRRLAYASHIMTVSEFIRREIIEVLKIPPDQVTAIPEAAAPCFRPRAREEVLKMLDEHGWPHEYILFVGTLEPRKNLSLLVRALALTKPHLPLILTGWEGWGEKQWQEESKTLGLKNRIITTGYVDESILVGLYSGASVFVYPSLYEGFGLPILEAMACGCPVICSNVASLPEVAGEAAALIDPLDPEALARALDRILSDSEYRASLIEKGFERASLFSWKKTALRTFEVFEAVSRRHGNG